MGLALRSASPADYEAIATWIPDAIACRRWAGPKVTYPFSFADLPRLLAVPGGDSCCLADEDGGSPLGFGQCWPRPDQTVHLLRIIVCPESRGKGFGRELCGRLLSRASELTSAQAVTLNVYRDNSVAVALYERLGFAVVSEKSSGDALFMIRPVPTRHIESR